MLSTDIGIDLGTASILVYIKGKGGFMDSGRVIPIGPNALVDYEEKNIMNRIRILNSHG